MKILNSKYFGIGFVAISTAFLALIDFIGICELSIFTILSPMVLLAIPVFIFFAWLSFTIVMSFAELTNDIVTKIENFGSKNKNEDR